MSKTTGIVDLFDRLAGEYDEVVPFFATFAGQLLDWVGVRPGDRVLDLGCGRGALALEAQRRGAEVMAVDAAPGMVRELTTRHPEIDAQVMDAHRLDFADASFDLVVSGFVVHLLADSVAAAAEVHRVLAPGGRFAFSWPGPSSGDDRWAFARDLNREYTAYAQRERNNGNDDEAEDILAGFVEVSSTTAEVSLPIPDADTYWAWACSHGSRAFIDALPEDRRAEYRARLSAGVARLDPMTIDRGAEFWQARKPSPPLAP
ncbi:MAG: methyltransferase domain-containing protein [Hamadaea sp.]|uniref:class I SAM-dependent methyltransferase n=1 Tax=Hamadaea sp. TaxID=2024425 RepID=UPI0018574204|nr:class I SAM-dependent methyltransferase [Hamadaea sp.]NUR69652.1 methyltransferase domain-containing protein [Hamadaea sp.]NUT19519.1 methyltransferase domain-containing protein [Hamadaea sp.]